ncbi:unnamed protein product [Calypogeia fissa]
MVTAVVSRGVALSSWVTPSERHASHHQVAHPQHQLRKFRHGSNTSSSLIVCCTPNRSSNSSSISTGTSSRASSSRWGSSGSQADSPGTSRNSIGVAGVQAETSDEVTGSSRTGGLTIGKVTVQGLREEMEDDALVLEGPLGFTYAAVFDGHVGIDAVNFLRDELYKECVDALQEGKLLESDDQNAVQEALVNAFHQTDTRLLSWLESDSEEKEAGATATILFMRDNSVTVAHVGDSRAVLSQGGKAVDLSGDHRPFGNSKTSVAEIKRIKTEGGWVSNGRLFSTLSVSRAFGDVGYKTKKTEMLEDGIAQRLWTKSFIQRFNLDGIWLSVTPDVSQIKLEDNAEFIIVASDGLWDSFKSNDAVQFIRKQLKKHGDVQKATEAIAQATLERQGQDNISIIILCFGKISQEEPGFQLW